ncbi:class I adenylate-forming enzyme family protein [Virgibacillus sp. W0430]|uniref:class I adenylate-forming enzyme family protein n=1 Tax=Virgibacillus sp. W0430 TaxID=3391580 RepID=UPI003F474400
MIGFNEVTIFNKEEGHCGVDEIGELHIRGPHVFSTYWNNDEATKEVFWGEWLKTGDLAKVDNDGDYYIIGRKKELIITGGENVYPQEVEQCILRMKDVLEAAVVGVDDEKWGEAVTAFIKLKDQCTYKEGALIAYCKEHLGGFKVPKRFVVLEELPKTDVGKIDKSKLRMYFQEKEKLDNRM